MWARHVDEPIALLELLEIPHRARVLDLGSGAGAPGIPIAVLRPDCAVRLIESDRRKAGFLEHVCGVLGLARVEVTAERAEVLGHREGWREAAGVVVSRATAPPAALCELALPLLELGGRLGALVGDAAAARDQARVAAAMCGGGEPRALSAKVLLVEKIAAAPARLPRRPGVPQRRPLGGGGGERRADRSGSARFVRPERRQR